MPSGLSLQKPRPGTGMVDLVDGAVVVPLGLMVVVEVGAAVVATGLEVLVVVGAVVVTPGFLVVVGGSGGISVRGGRNIKTTFHQKVDFGTTWFAWRVPFWFQKAC